MNKKQEVGIKHFHGLWTLIAMQFKEKMSFSFKADKKGALTKIILYFVLIVGVGAIISVLFHLLGKASIFAFGEVPFNIFNFFFIIMFVTNLISCLNGLTNSLYFSEDNQVLLTYPVKSNTVFFSKIIVYYFFELVKDFGMIVPYFIGYGIVNGFQAIYYPWVILMFLIIAIVPVTIGGILSIPLMYIKLFLKKYNVAQTIVFLLAVFGITALVLYFINLIPDQLDIAKKWATVYLPAINNFTNLIEKIFIPIVYLSMLITGYDKGVSLSSVKVFGPATLPILGCLIGFIIISILFIYFVCKPLFFKMASKPFEYAKKIISHDYKILEKEANNCFIGDYFVPDQPITFKNKKEERIYHNKMKKLLRKIKKEEKLFLNKKINIKRVLRFLNKYSSIKFKTEHIDNNFDSKFVGGFGILLREDVPSLVYIEDIKLHVHLYDPNYLPKQNHVKETTISVLFKDLIVDLRTPGVFLNNYIMVVLPPIALLLLNTIFNACGLKDPFGYLLAISFDIVLVLLMMLTTNISMASIYSREGKTSYMLKAMPIDFIRTLGTKLLFRLFLMIISIIATTIVFGLTNNRYYAKPVMFGFILFFIYAGHLLWSAELDYMNPQDKLYAETGAGNISNPNETISSILGMIIAAVIGFLTYFFLDDNNSLAMLKIMLIALVFFIARVFFFIARVKAYSTSRGERGKN